MISAPEQPIAIKRSIDRKDTISRHMNTDKQRPDPKRPTKDKHRPNLTRSTREAETHLHTPSDDAKRTTRTMAT